MNPINFYKYLPYYFRKRFKEKYIIIESDDWGMERALTVETLEWMKSKFGKENFTRWTTDALETNEDLDLLFDLLNSVRNKYGSCPVITANFITHNIDYENGGELKFKPISKGFNPESEDVREKYFAGISNGCIFPQLHGYSHYNLTNLKKYFESHEGREAFMKKNLPAKSTIKSNLSFLHGELSKANSEAKMISDAAEDFNKIFGFYSSTLIPPAFIFDMGFSETLLKNKITMVQSSNRLINSDKKKCMIPFFRKKKGIVWSIRNARLDPYPGYDYNHEQCLHSIKRAFANNSPAIIDFHRVNISGKFAPEYRSKTLTEFKKLIEGIFKSWPDVKFIHSQKLNEMLWQHQVR